MIPHGSGCETQTKCSKSWPGKRGQYIHDVACVMDLADEASEVLNGTSWSRQCCMEFHKELEWELQAYDKVVSKLELSKMSQT